MVEADRSPTPPRSASAVAHAPPPNHPHAIDAELKPSHPTRPALRIALAHDWLCGLRGGEMVLDRLAQLVTREHSAAGIYTMFDDAQPLTRAIDALPRTTSFLSHLPGGSGPLRRWLLPFYPAAVDALSRALARDHARAPIDLVISTSSAAIKGLRPPPGVPHLCYCHAPARYVWSLSSEYARTSALRRLGLALYSSRFRRWDRATASNVTTFIANSTHTARLIAAAFDRDAVVIHPPVRTDVFTPPAPAERRGSFWLFVAALEPYKRADLAIAAARRAQRELIIVGDGSERARLHSLARPGITFLGRVSDERLRELYRSASVLLFPQVEDFGIVAAEAQACGLPIAARRAGGALDIVAEGRTGAFFDDPAPEALAEAAQRAERLGADAHAACRASALRFSEDRFESALRQQIRAMTHAG